MITPKLEELIHTGLAQFKTFNCISSSNVLKLDPKISIIITDIWYYDFVDLGKEDLNDDKTLDKLNQLAIHQLMIRSPKSQNNLIIRDDFRKTSDKTGAVTGMKHYNVYFPHVDDVYIDLIHGKPAIDTTITSAAHPAISKEPPIPNGYGTVGKPNFPIPIYIEWAASGSAVAAEIKPLSRRLTKDSPGISLSYDRGEYPTDETTILNDPNVENDYFFRSFPVVNIGYVAINKEAGIHFMGS